MRINNKTFKEWTEDDLRILLDNDDFRESQFLVNNPASVSHLSGLRKP